MAGTIKPGTPVKINDTIVGVLLSYIQTENENKCRVALDPMDCARELLFISRMNRREQKIEPRLTETDLRVEMILSKSESLMVVTCFEFELKPIYKETNG